MNIFTFIEDSLDIFYIQPDTVICSEKEKCYYVPDEIKHLIAVPFVYVKIVRPCKAVKAEYAHRHYMECGYGVHLVSEDIDEGSVLDNSVFLAPATKIVNAQEGEVKKNTDAPYEGFESFDAAIERVGRHISLRTGDLITLDLPSITELEITEGSTQTINYQDLTIKVIS